MSSRARVVQMSSVHHVSDTRVFHKECKSLADAGFDVALIIQTESGPETRKGVRIVPFERPKGPRALQMIRSIHRMYRAALIENGDLYHFHDPELLPLGIALKLRGKRVIYDAHEHVAKQIRSKQWIPSYFRQPISLMYRAFERLVARWALDTVIVADPTQESYYPVNKVTVLENFPIVAEFKKEDQIAYGDRDNRVAYVGAITELRGAIEMVDAIDRINERLPAVLAMGGKPTSRLMERLTKLNGWRRVEYRGFLTREEVYRLYGESRIGIVVLHPIPNYVTSQPVKLLEYMLAGLPVVAANFPYYRQYVTDIGSGILVDPLDPAAIADAIEYLLRHPDEAESMGRNGRDAVLSRFSWEEEAKKLVALYERLLAPNQSTYAAN